MASAGVRAVVAPAEVVLLQLEIPMETVLAAARQGRDGRRTGRGQRVTGRCATRMRSAELAEVADVVMLNDGESEQWRWPVPHLVITRGADGATHVGPDGRLDIAAPAVEAVDTTGAGDVFAGVLAAGWLAGPARRAAPRLCGRSARDADTGGGRLRPDRRSHRRRA